MSEQSNRHPDTCIIIPVYNEASIIAKTIKEVSRDFTFIVCVNDGSRDNSAAVIRSTCAVLIDHPINMGQGAAIQTGIEYALQFPNIQYFVTYDADGQHNIEDVNNMLQTIKKDKVDIVLGSRFLGKASNMSSSKKVLLKVAVWFSNKTSGIKLTDAHNGLRAFNRHVAETIDITLPDMAHASEITNKIAQNNYSYVEAPVTINYTNYSVAKGQSMMNSLNILSDLFLNRLDKK